MIFKWLAKSGKTAPGDAENDFLKSLTGSPAAVLQQVSDWIDEQIQCGQADLNLLRQADNRLEPVLAEIVASLASNRRIGTGYQLLRTYCEHFARAYAHIARNLSDDVPGDKLIALLRSTYLYSRACRLARMTYNDPGTLRQEILTLYLEAQQSGLAAQRKSPYTGVLDTSVTQELAVALLWDTTAFDTLTLEQIEYLERFIVFNGSQIILKSVSGAIAPYAVLANGQVVMSEPDDAASVVLFIGPGPLVGMMAGIAKLPDSGTLPVWAEPALPHTDIQTLKALAQRMAATWGQQRVQRSGERKQRTDTVRVTGGFTNIRRAVAYSAYLRSGGQLDAYGTPDRIFSERMREVLVGIEEKNKELTPVEALTAIEGAGGSQAVESWTASDSSEHGYSLVVQGYRGWLAVGGLLAVRENDQIDWHVAVVRRLYGATSARRVGIELYRGTPIPVGVGNEGQTTNVSIADLRDAILITGGAVSWLVTSFDCAQDGSYLVVGKNGREKYKTIARSYGTADFQIYSCERVE